MSAQQPPTWGQPSHQAPAQPPKPFYRRGWFWVLVALVVGGLLFAACLAAVGAAVDEAANPTDATVKRGGTPGTTDAPAAAPVPAGKRYDTPALADFKLTVKELSRQRFGSAGDNVEYRVRLIQVRDRTYDPDKNYELTYRITGSESGAETQTMLIQGDQYETYEGSASTRSGVKVTAAPLTIEEV